MAQVIFCGNTELIKGSKLYNLAVKINNGERLSFDEKTFLYKQVNIGICTPRGCVMLMGVVMDFRQVMKRYFIESNNIGIVALWSFDKTTIRKNYGSKIHNIVEVPNRKTKN